MAPSSPDGWQKIVNNKCNIKLDDTDKYIYIRDSKNVGERYVISNYISTIVKMDVNSKPSLKLIKDEEKEFSISLRTVGSPNTLISVGSENEDVAKVEGNKIIAVGDGSTNIIIADAYGHSAAIQVQVTSLITLPTINNSKPSLKYKQYTQEEAKIIDEYLFYQVAEAGDNTRAGVVAAARFLSLEFKQRVPYFLENR